MTEPLRVPAGSVVFTRELSERHVESLCFLFSVHKAVFPWVQRAEREAIHWPPYSAEAKTGWSYTTTPDIRFHGIHREFFDLSLSCKEEAV